METPIGQTMTAIREGTVSEVRRLLAKYPELLAEKGPGMLAHAAESNRVDMLPILVAAGIDVNAAALTNTPLVSAASKKAFDAVQWLLDHGATIDGRAEPNCTTPLHQVIAKGYLDVVKFLLDRGADPNVLHGNPARNALAAAKFWRQESIATFLENQGIREIIVEPEPVDVEHPNFKAKDSVGPVEWFDKKWWHVYDYGTRRGLKALSEKNKVLFLVGYLIDQLCNGGAPMVYFNPSGEYTPQIAVALDKIGACRASQLIREINAMFPDGRPAKDHDTRSRQVEQLPERASQLGTELEQVFEECNPNNGERVLLCQLYDHYFG
ncbi:MAG TPA: ankyrin repeat domain-containing protein [Gemmataceae bacterium]|nr:ankyrin repeat domain-containing protein [Gemmataceae bacterium]